MTNEQSWRERTAALEAKATAGPWEKDDHTNFIRESNESVVGVVPRPDIELVIALRNAAPQLLALVAAVENAGPYSCIGRGSPDNPCGLCWACHFNAALAALNGVK